jgi:hypothetical protein
MSNTQKEHYRNLEDLISLEGIEVEAGSLWKESQPGTLVLVDDDQFASHALEETKFSKT